MPNRVCLLTSDSLLTYPWITRALTSDLPVDHGISRDEIEHRDTQMEEDIDVALPKMVGWSDGQMVRWSDGQMARWSDGQMVRW